MVCRICQRTICTESFHSIEEQEQYEEVEGKLVLIVEPEEGENDDTPVRPK